MNTTAETYQPVPRTDRTSLWGTILKIIAALATALVSAFGLQSCIKSL
ncbi:hypothetical protein EVA_00003 [gut metagenome]|uniref:Uncharacterized protein n=1 Tax=gut metagenome TaxID=749906 RepID=J9GT79_9ZZZZ